jgi:hypothetical protein
MTGACLDQAVDFGSFAQLELVDDVVADFGPYELADVDGHEDAMFQRNDLVDATAQLVPRTEPFDDVLT